MIVAGGSRVVVVLTKHRVGRSYMERSEVFSPVLGTRQVQARHGIQC